MIKIVYEEENKRAAAYDDSTNIGECTYSGSTDLWIIDHTFVEEKYSGQGIATKLVAELVKRAREKGMKILPLCPFAKKVFSETPEYADVLNK